MIFYVMGKSAAGKDTVYKKLLELFPGFHTVLPYTTRPIRDGETEGVEYHFTTEEDLADLEEKGKVIEKRTYQTIYGPWSYATVDDGQIDLTGEQNYLMIGTLESYQNTRRYFGAEQIAPLYLEVEDGERLNRALLRERQQKNPKYAELCRRFLADEEDFSDRKLQDAGIDRRFDNADGEKCLAELEKTIRETAGLS